MKILLTNFFIVFLFFSWVPLFAETVSLKIKLVNGTNKGIGSAEVLRVILLKEAMLPVKELNSVRGSFTIQDLNLPEGVPVLLQAVYKGGTYNKMIPPVPAMRSKEQVIEIYDSTSNSSQLTTRSLVQFIRTTNGLQVYKIYILQNKSNPPKSYVSEKGLDIYVPESAENLRGTWTQGDSKMGIPLSFKSKSPTIQSIQRAVLPGSTELQISFNLPWKDDVIRVSDQIIFENTDGSFKRPVFLRPQDMKLSIDSDPNPIELKDEIPEGLRAFMVQYDPKTGSTTFELSGGTPIQPRMSNEPRQIVNGSLIPDWDTALVSIVGLIAFLFSIQYITEFYLRKKQKNESN